MSWTDKKAIETIKKLRDRFNVKILVETGTFRGVNTEVHANNFEQILTFEAVSEYYYEAKHRLKMYENVTVMLEDSAHGLERIKQTLQHGPIPFFYLDAHFYDPKLPLEKRWVVVNELKALEGFGPCVIAIHDFKCNGLGHLIYDGQPLDFEFIEPYISKVNPNFHYYFNNKNGCDILTQERIVANEIPNLRCDEYVADNIKYAWSNPSKTYRGILYAVPETLDLTQFELVETR